MLKRASIAILALTLIATSVLAVVGCALSTHPVTPAKIGNATSTSAMLSPSEDTPRVKVERVDSARWEVDREGLINFDHPRAQKAGLQPGLEPIVISFWALEHPTRGRFIIDTGVAAAFRDEETAPVSSLVAGEMNFDKLRISQDLGSWVADRGAVDGVFLTHLHLDHIMGLVDLPNDVPVFTGPGETSSREFLFMFVQGTIDGLLEGKSALQEWQFAPDPAGRFEGVVDVFNDGSVYALHVPGHTPGSTAYFVHGTDKPWLIVGDASHTNWGWNHCVEPGTFSHESDKSVDNLHRLQAYADEIPNLRVELGHQHHEVAADREPCEPRQVAAATH